MKKAPLPGDDDFIEGNSQALAIASGRTFRRGLVLGLVIGALCGWAFIRYSDDSRETAIVVHPVERPDSPVTRETYARILPGATSWEVQDLLGSGQIIAEEGMTVDEQGQYRKWEHLGGRRSNSSGTLDDHDGQPVEEIRQTVRWENGPRAITVVFHNGKVVEKREENLY